MREKVKSRRFKNSTLDALQKGVNMQLLNWVRLQVVVLILLAVGGIFAYANISSDLSGISKDVVGLKNNAGFSSVIEQIENSVFMIIVQPLQNSVQPFTTAIYVDESGAFWSKGTGFSVTKEGHIVTALHVFGDINFSNKRFGIILKNGKKEDFIIENFAVNPALDLLILKTNLSIKPIKMAQDVKVPTGAKIGFIGYPLTDNQIVSDGIISGVSRIIKDVDNKEYYVYTINSFVNAGNSGGPVFLADTGEVIGIVNAKEIVPLDVPNIDAINLSAETKFVLQYQNYLFSQLQKAGQTGTGYSVGVNKYIFDVIGRKNN